MWYFYPCPACGRPISVFDNEPDPEYDVVPKLIQAVKDHYTAEHGIDKLLFTDDELLYEVKSKKQTSTDQPTW